MQIYFAAQVERRIAIGRERARTRIILIAGNRHRSANFPWPPFRAGIAIKRDRRDEGHIAATIQEELASGVYAPGARLTFAQVAARFDVSVTPVREALQRLVVTGALEHRRNRSVAVPPLDRGVAAEIVLIRSQIEGAIAARAAVRASSDDVTELRTIQDEEDAARAGGDYSRVLRANRRFHAALAKIADMPIAAGIMVNLWMRSGPILAAIPRNEALARSSTSLPHRNVIAALDTRDSAAAKQAIVEDIERGAKLALDLVENNPAKSSEPDVSPENQKRQTV